VTIVVLRPGFMTTVQDLGRPAYRAYGVAVGGAMDTLALRIGNALIGNADGEAGLEITLAGPELRFEAGRWIALTGGAAEASVDGAPLPMERPVYVPAGSVVRVGAITGGARAYLTVDGGFRLPRVLGGLGTDVRGGFGGLSGRRLQAGDVLPLNAPKLPPPACPDRCAIARIRPSPMLRPRIDPPVVRVMAGRETAEFAEESVRDFLTSPFKVSPQSDRMGIRLDGPRIRRTAAGEMFSTGVAPGTIQVPPNGLPIVLMADSQPTGGYPRIAQVAAVDLPALAQARPGDALAFALIGLEEAERLLEERERALALLRAGAYAYWRRRVRVAGD
jgi:antagonist of KipI